MLDKLDAALRFSNKRRSICAPSVRKCWQQTSPMPIPLVINRRAISILPVNLKKLRNVDGMQQCGCSDDDLNATHSAQALTPPSAELQYRIPDQPSL